ncbi:MAG: STAS domain-containing protein [Phycisphaerales bacterium]|jgi:anti-anti-sigma factor
MATEWSDSIIICDLADEPSLSEELNELLARLDISGENTPTNIVINMSDVTYLNSSNIAQLLRVRKFTAARSSKLKIAGTRDAVWSVMMLTGLDKVFDFAPDKATALASLQLESNPGQ